MILQRYSLVQMTVIDDFAKLGKDILCKVIYDFLLLSSQTPTLPTPPFYAIIQ